MKQRELRVIDQDLVVDAIDSRGGRYDRQVLVEEIPDAKYIFEVRLEEFRLYEPHTPAMYHGVCRGTITGYEIEGGGGDNEPSGPRMAVQVFEQEFDIDYPNGHPMPKEQMSEMIFARSSSVSCPNGSAISSTTCPPRSCSKMESPRAPWSTRRSWIGLRWISFLSVSLALLLFGGCQQS